MTEKNIFAYKLFLSLNISDFSLFFFVKITTCPWKKLPPSFPATLSQSWDPVKHPLFFENLVGGSTPSLPPAKREGGGGCRLWYIFIWYSLSYFMPFIYVMTRYFKLHHYVCLLNSQFLLAALIHFLCVLIAQFHFNFLFLFWNPESAIFVIDVFSPCFQRWKICFNGCRSLVAIFGYLPGLFVCIGYR